MQLQTKTHYYTPEEYLKLEEASEEKHEYRRGEIILMVGGTTNHNQICLNICRHFPLTIDDQDYYIYMENVRLWLSEYNIYTYPDIMIIKGEPIYQGKKQTNVTNPQIIIEVLSDSTEGYDRGDKFTYYRSLPTFQEYILINQSAYSVDQYVKQSDDQWSIKFYQGEDKILNLASVNWQISLQEIYQRIDFTADNEE